MRNSPYKKRPEYTFWSSGVAHSSSPVPDELYIKKWPIDKQMAIATAGSCFAQHIGRNLKAAGVNVLDLEPPPKSLSASAQAEFGFSLYSARFGNIYTARQLLQLAKEAFGQFSPADIVWMNEEGKYFDALRPGVEPYGLDSPYEVSRHREYHLKKVRKLFMEMDLFVFTLGLTEAWEHIESGTVYPTAPGTIAGNYDPSVYRFVNYSFQEIYDDIRSFINLIFRARPDNQPKFLLTVSPVPLTATATNNHVMLATTYSKSILRAVAGQLSIDYENIDYFPSYEIIVNPWIFDCHYEKNLRSVKKSSVEIVMKTFLSSHFTEESSLGLSCKEDNCPDKNPVEPLCCEADSCNDDVICEDAMLEAFSKPAVKS